MSDVVGTVMELWRYPVKSMLGERVPSLDIDARGATGDRMWAVQAPDGRLGSGKTTRRFRRMDGLLALHAAVEDGVAVVTLASGARWRVDDPGIHAAVGAELGREVTVAREAAVSHLDDGPVHLVTRASLAAWAAAADGATAAADEAAAEVGAVDVRRARPNLVVAVDGAGRVEDTWVGGTLAVGGARLRVTHRTERCVMVTAEQPGLPRAGRLLRALTPEDRCVGVYAAVVTPGRIAAGDAVRLLS